MRIVIPLLFCLLTFHSGYASSPDTLAPPNGNIIYSPNCTTGGLGTVFGFVLPPDPAATYQWQGPNGFTSSQKSFMAPDTGWYYMIVTSNNCLSEPDSVHIQYFTPPMVQISSSSPFYCPSADSIHLSAAANSSLLFWRRLIPNSSPQYLGSGPELHISGSQLGNATERIMVTANGTYGCEGMDTITLSRQGMVTASNPLLACPGDSLSLSVTGAGSFLWNTGDTTASLNTIADSASIFRVTVTDANGCATSGSQAISIQNGAYVSLQASPAVICPGDTSLLLAAGGIAYLWENGASSSSLAVAPQSPDTFRLTITTAEGCIVDKSIVVDIHPSPALPNFSCFELYESISLQWAFDPALSYTFDILSGQPGQLLNDSTLQVTGLQPGQATTVLLTATDSLSCAISAEHSCQAALCGLQAMVEPIAPICLYPGSQPIALSATIGGSLIPGSGWWEGTAVDSAANTFAPAIAGPGLHQLIYRYQEGPCSVDTIQEIQVYRPLSAPLILCERTPNRITFSWPQLPQDTLYQVEILSGQTGISLSDTAHQIENLMPGESVQLRILAHNDTPCGLVTATKTCQAVDCKTTAAPLTRLICPGESVVLQAASLPGAVFQWAPAEGLNCTDCLYPIASPDTTTAYNLSIVEANGCTHTHTTTVGVGAFPESLLPDTLRLCAGQPFFYCLPGEGNFRWWGPQGTLQLGPCVNLPAPGPGTAGTYTVEAILPGGCRFEKAVVFSLDESPGCGLEGQEIQKD